MRSVLRFCDIRPFIRYAQRLTVSSFSSFSGLSAFDNRFFYCAGGTGSIIIDGEEFSMQKGSLIIWPSGVQYSLLSSEGMELIGCNFDYTWEHSFLPAPIPPSRHAISDSDRLESISFSDAPQLSRVLYLKNMHRVETLAAGIYDEYSRHLSLYLENMSALFWQLLCIASREYIFSADGQGRKNTVVDEILLYISEHHREELNNTLLGERFGYHPNYINHLVVQHTGMSLHRYLLSIRINRAIDLLQTTDMPVTQISFEVGFADYNHFLKYFKQATGYTTKAFRNGK